MDLKGLEDLSDTEKGPVDRGENICIEHSKGPGEREVINNCRICGEVLPTFNLTHCTSVIIK